MRLWSTAGKVVAAALLFVAGCGTSDAIDTTGTATTTGTGGTATTGGTSTTSTTSSTSTTRPRCDEEAGLVTSYYPTGARDFCRPRVFEQRDTPLFSGDRLTTDSIGSLTFDTRQLTGCEMSPDTGVIIHPDAATELELARGTVGCDADATGRVIRLRIPHATVEVRGTLFILTAVGGTGSVKVFDGTVDIRATSDPSAVPVQVSGGSLAEAAPGRPLRTDGYTPTESEQALIDRLRLDILTFPPEALSDLAQSGVARRGTLVTETQEQAKELSARNLDGGLQPITTASIRRRSARALPEGATLIVGVGSFAALMPTFEQLRRELGPGATLVYSPYAFSAGRTTPGTSTTTTTTTTTTTAETTATASTTAPGPP
jgi:hypothetical protein